jgi:hypothetical protein
MNALSAFALLAVFASVIATGTSAAQDNATPAHIHVEFNFTAQAPYERVFPLFGALEEKKWAKGWDPQFVYPMPARDQQGMVFHVERGGMSSTWTCTAFDQAAGHVQYVYVVDGAMVTLIDIRVAKSGGAETHVGVVYERTALSAAANEHVAHLAKGDANSGPEWAEAINGYLRRARAQ